jgi:DMSO reductase family type II enzyme heme b subunit
VRAVRPALRAYGDGMFAHRALVLLPWAAATLLFANCQDAPPTRPNADPANGSAFDRGAALFARHCAVCHGSDGSADTLVASLLVPRPTAFADGMFTLVGTQNGMPSDDDLTSTLRRGMPGSTMMAFDWLPADDLLALAQHVRALAVRGRATAIANTAQAVGRPVTAEQAHNEAERALAPGAPIATPEPNRVDAATLGTGEALFAKHCAGCHGQDGRGLPGSDAWPTDGVRLWPRDFTAGYLRGGASVRELALRIRAGMPGAHMPPTALAEGELLALASYVQRLVPEAARSHHVQWRRTLRVAKLATLPTLAGNAADDEKAFAAIEAVRLPLVPLRWRRDAASEVWLQAAHDGTSLLLRLSWQDDRADTTPRPELAMGDGAAVQFASGIDAPLFAMGSPDRPVAIWRWHAFDPKSTAGGLDLRTPLPHGGLDVAPRRDAGGGTAEALVVAGVPSIGGEAGNGLPLDAAPRWHDGRWTLTLRRALAPHERSELPFVVGEPLLFALAVWDGSRDASPASKAISTWHVLELQR